MSNNHLARADVYGVLRRAIIQAGGQSAWAAANNLSASYVSDVVNARCELGPSILRALNIRAVTHYEMMESN